MDVRDANRPKMISQIPTSEPASSVEIDSGYAYLCAGELIVLDIRNANRIRVLARRQMPGSAYRVALAEGRAYVAALDGGVQVFDVAAPANPRAIGSYETKGNVTHITMAGTRAYVLDSLVGGANCGYDGCGETCSRGRVRDRRASDRFPDSWGSSVPAGCGERAN